VNNGLEAVADAIMQFEGWRPGTRSYENRNPGNLEIPGSNRDDKGYSIFPDFISGYSALLRELQSKFSGNNAHGIGPGSTLLALFNVYAPPSDNNPTNQYCLFVAGWVTKALGKTITPDSLLSEIWTA
jgi:hypothetical protein